ncbi:NHP10 [Candida pseudojiufengensis]|uniref:NHP10 n=1 Tax=Candida pseudojiufengensis TaxID=497109 RepID=UPI002224269A|nr:NHP10 [Candida pseudojiufengensis]KAI5959628.1 NHP10 [Candida pseudojiufengensis]
MKTQNPGESEEDRFKQKCKDLQKRIKEVEESNEIATIAYSRTQSSIRRLRLEYAILMERLEERSQHLPDGIVHFEEMAGPPTPNILDESIVKNSKNGSLGSSSGGTGSNSKKSSSKKSTKSSSSPNQSSSTNGNQNSSNKNNRDPDLPKRPTNAYLLFCEQEKEKLKNDESNNNKDLSKLMTEAWKNLNEEDRKPFYKLYEDDKLRYQREMTEYNEKKELEEQSLQNNLDEGNGQNENTEHDQTKEEEGNEDDEERDVKRQKLEQPEEADFTIFKEEEEGALELPEFNEPEAPIEPSLPNESIVNETINEE